jgi:glycine/D-amino acid oxidase-like deaminating enzyme
MSATQAAVERPEQAVEEFETIVIGGGQAGLSMGYYLKGLGQRFVILDANERIGGAWRTRTWDSLQLFTPARYDGLPGWGFPAAAWSFPTARETADYLEAYAERFELPVRSGWKVGATASPPTTSGTSSNPARGASGRPRSWSRRGSTGHRACPGSPASSTHGSCTCTRASTATRRSCAPARSSSWAPATRARTSR